MALTPEQRRLGLIRGIGVLILTGIPLYLLMHPQTGLEVAWPGGRLVWTCVIAIVPLAIVAIGFYTWRQICPLAFFGRMSEWLGWPDRPGTREEQRRRRRVSPWLARNYPYVTWGSLAAWLALRVLVINSNVVALAVSFVGLLLLAALTGFRYTGKSWCNFFCPVYTIEMLYTEGDRPQYRRNSQCPTCTGCKTVPSGGLCPDINQENDYWQELKNPARAFAYYAFPGLVLGFYVWYFLHQPYYWHERQGQVIRGELVPVQQPGTRYDWGYYLSGDWTRDPRPWTHWLEPGFGLHGWPYVPILLAAPLTLAAFAAISWLFFRGIEALWLALNLRGGAATETNLEAVRHPLFAWAGFSAFTIFYTFAGAPTWRYLPFGLYGLFHFGVIVLAAWVLHTRLSRTRTRQLQFDQARKWVKKWPFPHEAVPRDLDEAYTKYTLRMQFSEHRLRAFQEAVRHTLVENLITVAELKLLDRLAADLGVNEAEQKKVLKQIGREMPELFAPEKPATVRDRLQLLGYFNELERMLTDNGVLPEGESLRELQRRYRVEPGEHEAILRELQDRAGAHASRLRQEVTALQRARQDVAVLAAHSTPSIDFLRRELEEGIRAGQERVRQMARLYAPSDEPALAGEAQPPGSGGEATVEGASPPAPGNGRLADELRWHLPAELVEAILDALSDLTAPAVGNGPETDVGTDALSSTLLRCSAEGDRYVRAAALYSLRWVVGDPAEDVTPGCPEDQSAAQTRAEQGLRDPDPLIREAAVAVCRKVGEPIDPGAQGDPDSTVVERESTLGPAALPPPTFTTLEKLFMLRRSEVLSQMSADRLHFLAERTVETCYRPGETLCVEGERGDAVYILIEGRTEATKRLDGQEVRLGVHRTGECIGEMAVLGEPGPRYATVRVLEDPVRVLRVEGEAFRQLLGGDATTSLRVIRLLIDRQRRGQAST